MQAVNVQARCANVGGRGSGKGLFERSLQSVLDGEHSSVKPITLGRAPPYHLIWVRYSRCAFITKHGHVGVVQRPAHGTEIVGQLGGGARPDDDGGDPLPLEAPPQRYLGNRLSGLRSDPIHRLEERPDLVVVGVLRVRWCRLHLGPLARLDEADPRVRIGSRGLGELPGEPTPFQR